MKLKFFILTVVVFYFSQLAFAQKTDNNQVITCVVKPSVTIVGGSVLVTGETINDGKQQQLNLTLTKPDKSISKIGVKLNADGSFSTPLKQLGIVGNYTFVLTTLDNKFKQNGSFKVLKSEDIANIVINVMQNFTLVKTRLNDLIKKCKPLIPPVLQTKLDKAQKSFDNKSERYLKAMDKAKLALQKIGEALKLKPADNEVGIQQLNNLATEFQEVNDNLLQLKNQFAQHKASDVTVCEVLMVTSEACAAFSTFTNLQNTLIKTTYAVCSDKVYPVWADVATDNANSAFLMKEGTKLGLEAAFDLKEFNVNMSNPTGAGAGLYQGIGGDLLQFIADQALLELCGVWKGNMLHEYVIDNTTENVRGAAKKTWWKYGVQMGAVLTLRYPKNQNDNVIKMKGNLEGNATKFDFYDDPTSIESTKDLKGGKMVKHFRKTPIAVPFVVADNDKLGFGAAARAIGTPSYFNIPVDAEYDVASKKITLFVNDALVDFTPLVANRSLFMYWAVLPIIRCQIYPILPAQTTIKGTLKENPTFDVKVVNGKLQFDGIANLNKTPDGPQAISSKVKITATKIN